MTAASSSAAHPLDASVIRGMQAGADWAWHAGWDQLAVPLAAYARTLGADASEAEDLAAEAFSRLIAHRHELPDTPGSVRAWAFAITRNLLIDDRRSARHRRTRSVGVHEQVTQPMHVDLVDDTVADVMAALRVLPKQQREVIVLHVYGELTLREAGYVLGISHAAARKAFSRAAARLRTALDGPDRP